MAISVGVIGFPTVLVYLWLTYWHALVYFFFSTICVFYAYTKNRRVFLDVFILAIASIVAANVSQFIKFAIFMEESLLETGVSVALFLLFFVFFVYIYRLFIQKIWHSIIIPVIGQFILIVIAGVTASVLYINLFISYSRNLFGPAMFNLAIETSYFVLMFILSVILLRNVKKENRLKRKEIEQQQLLHYVQSLEQINKDMQSFRHDYQNILLTMQGYLNENNIDGLKAYFNDHIVKVEKKALHNHYILDQLDNVKLVELKGLLSTKVLLANESKIDINVEVPDTIQVTQMNIVDLTRIIGILMDNAIEASADLADGQLNIAFLKKADDAVLIILENRVANESINIEQLFEPGYSTKGKDRGTGLTTVREIVNQYPNITMNTRIEDGFFIHEIEIKPVVQKEVSLPFIRKRYS